MYIYIYVYIYNYWYIISGHFSLLNFHCSLSVNYRPVLGTGVFMMSDIVSDLSSYCEVGETDAKKVVIMLRSTRQNEVTEVRMVCVCPIM